MDPGFAAAFLKRFVSSLEETQLIDRDRPLVVGVSGGVDSIALLDLLSRFDLRLHVSHVNYGLRGNASDKDEYLVRNQCARMGLPIAVHRPDRDWRESLPDRSLQEAARDFRYAAMLEFAREIDAPAVAVAHHMNDQAETILLRMMRGTGARGLGGMRLRRPLSQEGDVELVRPLLFASRDDIAAYAAARSLPFTNDRSNRDDRFERTRIRHVVMPAIRESFGESAIRNIVASAARVRELVDDGVGRTVDDDLVGMTEAHPGYVRLMIRPLADLPAGHKHLILLRALEHYLPEAPRRASIVKRLEALMVASPGKHVPFLRGAVWRDREALVFVPDPILPEKSATQIECGGVTETTFGRLTVQSVALPEANPCNDRNTEVMDASVLNHPLSVGSWRAGERFQPLGLSGTKKISDLLTDAKVPTYLRQAIPVVRSGDDVVWVPGFRLAHRFRLTSRSTSAVRMTFESALRPNDYSLDDSM